MRPLCPFAAVLFVLAANVALGQAPLPDLRSVAGRPEVWPHDILTKAPVAAAAKNAPPIPAGTSMKVVGLEGPLIDLDYGGGLFIVPVAQTDFLERAGANLSRQPAPLAAPRATPSPLLPPPPAGPGAPAAPGTRMPNALGAALAPALLVFDPASKVDHLIPGGQDVIKRGYLLLQFGGGRRWQGAMKELVPAIQAARDRGADFDTILIPLQSNSLQSAIMLYRESSFSGPMVDARKSAAVADLWTQFGHEGTFALALVDARGQVIAHTIPLGKNVDKFHGVLAALAQLPKS